MRKTIMTFISNYKTAISGHARRLWRREERAQEALAECLLETRKLAHDIVKAPPTEERKAAIHSVKKGIQAYNAKNYEQAVRHFRKASECDANYARAFTYLGNALYKRGRLTEAVSSWHKAVEVEPDSDAAANARMKLQRFGADAVNILHVLKND